MIDAVDSQFMMRAIEKANESRLLSSPNPWVGAILLTEGGELFEGATQREGQDHAEVQALKQAGEKARGATLYVTLEPCCHQGSTPPCVNAIVEAGVKHVVIGIKDPDVRVLGEGIHRLKESGVVVTSGVCREEIEKQLRPYLVHRRTGRPYVVLKLASTLDGQIAAADGTSKWITGSTARHDVHQLRAESDAILVGAGTVRKDDPSLTVRGITTADGRPAKQPLRVILGEIPASAKVHPSVTYTGELEPILESLGSQGIVQLLVEGGSQVAAQFHGQSLVDQYRLYLAPAFMGGSDGLSLFSGEGASSVVDLQRCSLDSIVQLGDDLRLDLLPKRQKEVD